MHGHAQIQIDSWLKLRYLSLDCTCMVIHRNGLILSPGSRLTQCITLVRLKQITVHRFAHNLHTVGPFKRRKTSLEICLPEMLEHFWVKQFSFDDQNSIFETREHTFVVTPMNPLGLKSWRVCYSMYVGSYVYIKCRYVVCDKYQFCPCFIFVQYNM